MPTDSYRKQSALIRLIRGICGLFRVQNLGRHSHLIGIRLDQQQHRTLRHLLQARLGIAARETGQVQLVGHYDAVLLDNLRNRANVTHCKNFVANCLLSMAWIRRRIHSCNSKQIVRSTLAY
jgi:hypothetical protein